MTSNQYEQGFLRVKSGRSKGAKAALITDAYLIVCVNVINDYLK